MLHIYSANIRLTHGLSESLILVPRLLPRLDQAIVEHWSTQIMQKFFFFFSTPISTSRHTSQHVDRFMYVNILQY